LPLGHSFATAIQSQKKKGSLMWTHGRKMRRPNTGAIHTLRWGNGRYMATLPPEGGEKRGKVLGRYDTRYAAEKALEAWLEQRKAG
jgi:hypothetical protein